MQDLATSLEVGFIYTTDDPTTPTDESNLDMSSVYSGLGGLTFGLSWEEKNVNFESGLMDYDVLNVHFEIKYHVFFQGIGTVWTQRAELVVMIHKTTGTIYNIYY